MSRFRTRRARAEHFAAIVRELPPDRQRELFPRTARKAAFRIMWAVLLLLIAALVALIGHRLPIG